MYLPTPELLPMEEHPVFPSFANKTAKEILVFHNLNESHWGKRIIRAENIGEFTTKDRNDSSSWVTCACGKKGNLIEWKLFDQEDPLSEDLIEFEDFDDTNLAVVPKDSILEEWGRKFWQAVSHGTLVDKPDGVFIDAAKALVNIEHRVSFIAFEKRRAAKETSSAAVVG